ncbi:MAG: bifunctional DNA primase/polymerase [Hyphomicrobiaceae bacterium]|nr:bifunctional DNA primase/polymerase [Hyphomicrobiaceae bacterium]MCC0009780.1 bifunctional DNA primase/polymerase [Hyphomicrobiaceae bacterium]
MSRDNSDTPPRQLVGKPDDLLVKQYIDAGWHLLLMKGGEKAIREKGWNKGEFDLDTFREKYRNTPDRNIGVLLTGKLVDIDLDTADTRALGDYFFPEAPSFRRHSLRNDYAGHRFVYCDDAPGKAMSFEFTTRINRDELIEFFAEHHKDKPKLKLLEVRNGKVMTTIPPSYHMKGRMIDDVNWDKPFDPANIPTLSYVDVVTRGARLAFASIALRAYPKGQGTRDEYCLRLAGALIALGWDADEGDDLIVHIAKLAGDEEAEQRRGKCAQTKAKADEDEEVSGLPAFLESIGIPSAEHTIRKSWFGGKLKGPRTAEYKNEVQVDESAIDVNLENIDRADKVSFQAMMHNPTAIFIYMDRLVSVVFRGEKAPGAHATIREFNWQSLRTTISAIGVRFKKWHGQAGKFIPVSNPNADIYNDLLKSPERWGFPHLRGVSLVPTLTRSEPGFDRTSGLYLAFPEGMYPAIPDKPTKADAQAAFERLMYHAAYYEWEGKPDRSVYAAGLMTAAIRPSMPGYYPAFAIDATKSGSGKTYLGKNIATTANGGAAASPEPWNPNPQEFEKRLYANAKAGERAVLYDNIKTVIQGSELELYLSAGEGGWKARTLGESESPRVPADSVVIFCGNLMRFGRDMTRRVMRCGLAPKADRPEDRTFPFNPVDEYRREFPQRVVDILTIIRAFQQSGDRMDIRATDFGAGFRLIQGALMWIGEPDPGLCVEALRARDAETAAKGQIVEWLYVRFHTNTFTASDVARRYAELEGDGLLPRQKDGSRQTPAQTIGTLLATVRDNRWGGLMLTGAATPKGWRYWIDGKPEIEPDPPAKEHFRLFDETPLRPCDHPLWAGTSIASWDLALAAIEKLGKNATAH